MNKELFALMAHAEDLQKIAGKTQDALWHCAKNLEENAAGSILSKIQSGIDKTLDDTKKELLGATSGLVEASNKAKAAGDSFKRSGLFLAAILIAVALVVGGVSFGLLNWFVKSRINELAELKTAIKIEEKTLVDLRAKTWGLELLQENSKKIIVLPKGFNFGDKGNLADGRQAIIIR